MAKKSKQPMTEAAREHQEIRMHRLEATIQHDLSMSVELAIANQHARECRIGRAQARDTRQQLVRDFRQF